MEEGRSEGLGFGCAGAHIRKRKIVLESTTTAPTREHYTPDQAATEALSSCTAFHFAWKRNAKLVGSFVDRGRDE